MRTPMLLVLAALSACSSNSTGSDAATTDQPVADVAADAASDTPDAAVDVASDSPVDVVSDRADAAPADATDVVVTDVARDTSADIASDAAGDVAGDVAQDAAPDVVATDGGCARPDVMVLTERIDCGRGGGTCPAGYECLSFSGVVLQQYCGRSCRTDCDCPATQRCGSYTDKAGTHPLCVSAM